MKGEHCALRCRHCTSAMTALFGRYDGFTTSALDLPATHNRRRHTAFTRPDGGRRARPCRDVVGQPPWEVHPTTFHDEEPVGAAERAETGRAAGGLSVSEIRRLLCLLVWPSLAEPAVAISLF
jgi:hypothetical protein